jgi:hypothetical protein
MEMVRNRNFFARGKTKNRLLVLALLKCHNIALPP